MTSKPEHWAAMVATGRRVSLNEHDAEDAAAKALLELHIAGRLETSSPALLRTAARRRSIDDLRAASARRAREALTAERDYSCDPADDIAARSEARWIVEEARSRMTPGAAALAQLLQDGHNVSSAAEHMGVTLVAARSQFARLRALLLDVKQRAVSAISPLGVWWGARGALGMGMAVVAGGVVVGGQLLLDPSIARPDSVDRPPVSALNEDAPARLAVGAPTSVREVPVSLTPARRTAATTRTTTARLADRGTRRVQHVFVQAPVTKAGAEVSEGDTGGQEATPLEVVVACLEDFQVSTSRVGCAG